MTKPLRRRPFTASLFGFVALGLGASPEAFAIEQLSVGDSVRVACENTPVYAAPSAYGVPVDSIEFGKTIKVNALEGAFELPDSDFNSKKQLETQDSTRDGDGSPVVTVEVEEYTRYSWADIGSTRFVPTSCLVSEKNFGDQTIERAEEKVRELTSAKAKRNFSEDEKEGDLRAVRGTAGRAEGGAADYATIDRLIEDAQGAYEPSSLMGFRKAGGLGEYK